MSDPLTHLEQFAWDFHQQVLLRAGDNANPQMREDAFTEETLALLNEHNTADGADVCHHQKEGRGKIPAAKANAWALSGDGAALDLFVVLYHGAGKVESVPRSAVIEHFKLLRGFLRRAREGFHAQLEETDPAFIPAQSIHAAKDSLATVRLFFLTDGVVKSVGDFEQEQLPGLELQYVLWDMEKLSHLRVGKHEVIKLDFVKDYDGAIPCLKMADSLGEYKTFLAFVRAPLLAQIYGQYNQRLLERNVRAFLQSKGKVNKGLQETLREQPNRFLAYNNGLCCTAATVELESDGDGHAKLQRVTDFQIVNGGQTTASIFHAMKKEKVDISQVVVQVKLTVLNDPDPKKVDEIVPLISKFANSQNKVNGADFSAKGLFHQGLEGKSRTLFSPSASGLDRGTHWYYERARGSYLDDKARQATPAKQRDWVAANPPNRKFTKTDLAKYELAWAGLPHLVCRGAEKCFLAFAERMEDEGEPAVDDSYFHHTIAKVILFREAERQFSSMNLIGYRANSVAYAVAWIAERSRHRLNLTRIWDEQSVPPVTLEVLRAVCQAAYQHITETSGNVGEGSKKAECWESFRNKSIEVGPNWESEWADSPFINSTVSTPLAQEWEHVRVHFLDDSRTLADLEALTGIIWQKSMQNESVRVIAGRKWSELKGTGGRRRFRNTEVLVQLFLKALASDTSQREA